MDKIEIIDIEFIFRPNHEGHTILSCQSKSLNISSHHKLDDDYLKANGLKYLQDLCKASEQNMSYQYANGLIGQDNRDFIFNRSENKD